MIWICLVFYVKKTSQKLMLRSDLTGLMMCYIPFFSLGSFLSNNQKLLLITRQFRSWTSIVVSGPRKQVFTNHTQILRKWYLLASFSWEPEWIWKWSGRGNADLCRVHPFINVRQLVSPKMSFQPATYFPWYQAKQNTMPVGTRVTWIISDF